jgi:hypothetical protein
VAVIWWGSPRFCCVPENQRDLRFIIALKIISSNNNRTVVDDEFLLIWTSKVDECVHYTTT